MMRDACDPPMKCVSSANTDIQLASFAASEAECRAKMCDWDKTFGTGNFTSIWPDELLPEGCVVARAQDFQETPI